MQRWFVDLDIIIAIVICIYDIYWLYIDKSDITQLNSLITNTVIAQRKKQYLDSLFYST